MSLSTKTILIITLDKLGNYSETFIRAHVSYLPGNKHTFSNRSLLRVDQNVPSLSAILECSRLILQRIRHKKREFSKQFTHFVLNEIQRICPDIILVEYGVTAALYIEPLIASNIPFVVHFHGYDASVNSIIKNYVEEYQKIAQSASAIIAVSNVMKKKLISLGFPENRVHCCRYGVETDLFSKQVQLQDNSPIFLATGRFVEKKAPYLTLLAFDRLRQTCSDAKLVMIGDGPLLKLCRLMVKDLHLEESVQFLGSLPHEKVADWMYRSRCFVQHSVQAYNGDSEGSPVSIMEAMMAGLPVIATRHAGIPDMIEHEKNGFLTDEGDIYSMAKNMRTVIENTEYSKQIGQNAREFAMREFCVQKQIAKLASIIEGVLCTS
jgi:glycosyltransferase involved in cell wall biosynthesis